MATNDGGLKLDGRTLWITAGVLLAAWLVWMSMGTVALLFLALLLASALRPAVDFLARRMPRSVAAWIVMVALAAAVIAAAAAVLPSLVSQATAFFSQLPVLVASAANTVDSWRMGLLRSVPGGVPTQLDEEMDKAVHAILTFVSERAAKIIAGIPQALGLVLVPVLTLFILQDGPNIGSWLLGLAPKSRRDAARRYFQAGASGLDRYVRGMTIICLLQALQASVVFTLLGLPYSVLLGLLAGLAEAVPYAGSAVVGALIVVSSLSMGGWHWAWGLGAYIVLNQIVNLVITPRVMSQHAELHPLATLLAVAAGAELGGIAGVLMALPLTAVLKAVMEEARKEP